MNYSTEAAFQEARRRIEEARRTQAAALNLRSLGLHSIPTEIVQLTQLKCVYLDNNLLQALPKDFTKLSHLQELYLRDNCLKSLPLEILQLTQLRRLSLADNELRSLPKDFGKLTRLQELYLDINQLQALPKTFGKLTELRELYLSCNPLRALPQDFVQLTKLESLHLRDCQLSALPQNFAILSKLQVVSLAENDIQTLPEGLAALSSLKALYLHENSALKLPADVLGPTWKEVNENKGQAASPATILDYYYRSRASGGPLNEVKVVLVGRGGSGKTSLVKRLVQGTFSTRVKETSGISITDCTLSCGANEVKLHLWDFAGQEITHGTHQFFFSERSVYLLLLTGREGNAERDADYWLRLIRAFGGESPVIVVLNKIEQSPFELDESAIQQAHSSVRAFQKVDCKTGFGSTELLNTLKETVSGMESVHVTFPSEWVRVKDRLSGMEENYLSLERYREVCKEKGVEDFPSQDLLAGHLHRLGIALNYADDARVRHALVLNPGWVTDGIYKIVRGAEKAVPPGELLASRLSRFLPQEEPDMRIYLVNLMRKFELCFALDSSEKRFLIPAVLSVKSPVLDKEWDTDQNAVRLRYDYEALPQGLLPRFIVRTYVLSKEQRWWRTGVMLAFEGAKALVRAVQSKQECIEIVITGPPEAQQRLAAVVLENFRVIHDDIKALEPKLMVEVAGGTNKYERLGFIQEEARKNATITVDAGRKSLAVQTEAVVNRVASVAVLDAPPSQLRLFVSYSRKDTALKVQFDTNLKIMAAHKLIIPWTDNRLAGGEEWHKEIQEAIEAAHIIVFLVSKDFLASDYIRTNEMPLAMAKAEAGDAVIVPVILKDCVWEPEPWSKYNALPKPLKLVKEFADAEAFFHAVDLSLREVIEREKSNLPRQRRLDSGIVSIT